MVVMAVLNEIWFDKLLDALSNIQRRSLLVALLEHNHQDDWPIVIVDDDNEKDEITELIRMKHIHLPKLAEYGFIAWDRTNNEVSKGPAFEEIRPFVELLETHQDELSKDGI